MRLRIARVLQRFPFEREFNDDRLKTMWGWCLNCLTGKDRKKNHWKKVKPETHDLARAAAHVDQIEGFFRWWCRKEEGFFFLWVGFLRMLVVWKAKGSSLVVGEVWMVDDSFGTIDLERKVSKFIVMYAWLYLMNGSGYRWINKIWESKSCWEHKKFMEFLEAFNINLNILHLKNKSWWLAF